MKRITAIVALLAAASTIGLGNAFAQGNAVRATMPFDFTVGNKVLPAGTYTITVTATCGSVVHTAQVSLTVTP